MATVNSQRFGLDRKRVYHGFDRARRVTLNEIVHEDIGGLARSPNSALPAASTDHDVVGCDRCMARAARGDSRGDRGDGQGSLEVIGFGPMGIETGVASFIA